MTTAVHVAICSHARADTLAARTLPLLLARGILPDQVTVWASEPTVDTYLAADLGVEVQPAPLGLRHARAHALRQYGPGARVLFCDDDLRDVVELDAAGKLQPAPDLAAVAARGFTACQEAGCHLWGVSPVANAFYMKPGWTAGLLFAMGGFYGVHVPADPEVLVTTHDEKEDYERTLRAWEHDGAVVRLRHVAMVTGTYRGSGGMVDTRTVEAQEDAVVYLEQRWPGLVRRNLKRSTGFPEIKLSPRRAR